MADRTHSDSSPSERERFLVYRCLECGKIAEGWKLAPRYCAGSQWLMETPLEPTAWQHQRETKPADWRTGA